MSLTGVFVELARKENFINKSAITNETRLYQLMQTECHIPWNNLIYVSQLQVSVFSRFPPYLQSKIIPKGHHKL